MQNEDYSQLAIRVLNTWQFVEENPLYFVFDDEYIESIGGIENAKNEVDYLEKFIVKLQAYQDRLQAAVDHKKNRRTKKETFAIKLAHIYVMKDKRSGYHKIGRSINPQYRERTLQSEYPLIETVFISPLTPTIHEGKLHRIFKEKRVRGEWFDLSEEDVDFIINFQYEHNNG